MRPAVFFFLDHWMTDEWKAVGLYSSSFLEVFFLPKSFLVSFCFPKEPPPLRPPPSKTASKEDAPCPFAAPEPRGATGDQAGDCQGTAGAAGRLEGGTGARSASARQGRM